MGLLYHSRTRLKYIAMLSRKFVSLTKNLSSLNMQSIYRKSSTHPSTRWLLIWRGNAGNAHYWKREYFEIGGIPRDVFNQDLESKAIKVFNKVCCEISSRDIEAFHSFTNSNDKIMAKCLWWKDCDQVLSVKRDLRKVTLKDVVLRGCNAIFINQIWSR